jgi:hypothetical protein
MADPLRYQEAKPHSRRRWVKLLAIIVLVVVLLVVVVMLVGGGGGHGPGRHA